MKTAISGVLVLFSAAVLADHTVEHNADGIDLNRQSIQNQRDRRFEEDRRIDAGVALSNALGSHQYDFNHNGIQASIGLGGFRGESGASFGFAIKPSDNTLLNMQGGQTSEGDQSASISLNFKF